MNLKFATMLAGAALLIAAGPQAHAQDTTPAGVKAGVLVENTASVSYEINDVVQTTPATGDVDFVVDRLVDLTVSEVGGTPTSVTPGATNQMLTFSVKNDSNDVIDVALSAVDKVNGTQVTLGSLLTDNTNTLGTFTIAVDAKTGDANEGVYDAGDTLTYIDQLDPGDTRLVFVFASMPDDTVLNNSDVMVVELIGTAHSAYANATDTSSAPGTGVLGAQLTSSQAFVENKALVQNVFADDADAGGAGQYNGKHSAYDAYQVANTSIVVTKSFGILSDPFTPATPGAFPKAIPGAVVVYCIKVENNGSTDATDVTVSDQIPTNTTYVEDSIRIAAGAVDCAADPAAAILAGDSVSDEDDTDDGDAGAFSGGLFTGPITTVTPSLEDGQITTTIFQVTID